MTRPLVTQEQIDAFHADGVVLIRGAFADWVDVIRAGIDRSMRAPGNNSSDYARGTSAGRFFDDFWCWPRVPEFLEVVRRSPAAELAATLMRSRTSQLFHDHVLVKEPGTEVATPWHQDAAYFFLDGSQTVNLWLPVDPVEDATLRCIAGSHRWPKLVLPVRWLSEQNFYTASDAYIPIPDPDAEPEKYRVLEWAMQPGDAVAFHYRTLHGARGNTTTRRRRAFSLRFVGDDARYVERPGRTSPPFPGHDMKPGQRLREDWFPVLWGA